MYRSLLRLHRSLTRVFPAALLSFFPHRYHKTGNLGFIGFSGAAAYNETLPYFEEACLFMADGGGRGKPVAVFLLGHWNKENAGCAPAMETQDVHAALVAAYPAGCGELKYMDGHDHCNQVENGRGLSPTAAPTAAAPADAENFGFLIGGHGMTGCGQYGLVLLDSTGGSVGMDYFELASDSAGDGAYGKILDCVSSSGNGLVGCTDLAMATWL